jgi:hypothetical protein
MNISNNCVKDNIELLEDFLAENPVDVSKYSNIDQLQFINSNTNVNYILIQDECLICNKRNDKELYKIVIPCLVFPKSKYMIKGEKIRWEEINFLLCKEHLYLINLIKQKQEYPIGWDDWDILDSLSCIFNDLINNEEKNKK